jgi:filamentous hemagglutinin family protein
MTRNGLPFRLSALGLAVASCFGAAALANPTGPQVMHGQAAFAAQGNTLTITNSPGTIINWQGFSIGADEVTRFLQQSSSSAVLNRVVGPEISQLLGVLQSNGRVFLVNPSGIIIGRDARIDVAGLVASTLNLRDQDFLAGRLNFETGALAGDVRNHGTVTTPSGGSVYLIGANVENSGIIRSPDGAVVLAAGRSVKLGDSAAPGVGVEIQAGDERAVNLGEIITRNGSAGIYAGLIEQHGIVQADSVAQDASGKIVFRAGKDVTLGAGSQTSASGPAGGSIEIRAERGTGLVQGRVEAVGAAEAGGSVRILGERVAVAGNATVDASGALGGGTILIGGDYRGANDEVQNARVSFVGRDAVIRSDAITRGDGGRLIVWSEQFTRIDGRLGARGAGDGRGGFIETSSRGELAFRGDIELDAPSGRSGTWLLDPGDTVLQGGSGGPDDNQLDADVPPGDLPGRILAGDGGLTAAFTVSEQKLESVDADIILESDRSITVLGLFSNSSGNPGDAFGKLALRAGRSLTLATTFTGPASLTGFGGIDLTSSIEHGAAFEIVTSGGGSITLSVSPTRADGRLIAARLTAQDGDIVLSAPDVQLLGAASSQNGDIVLTANALDLKQPLVSMAGTVEIRTLQPDRAVDLGAPADLAAALTVSPSELVVISAPRLRIAAGTLLNVSAEVSANPTLTELALEGNQVQINGAIMMPPGGDVALTSSGAVTQNAGGIQAGALTVDAVSGISLAGPNRISAFSASNSGTGDVVLNVNPSVTIGSIVNAGGGISLSNGTFRLAASAISASGVFSVTAGSLEVLSGSSSITAASGDIETLQLSAADGLLQFTSGNYTVGSVSGPGSVALAGGSATVAGNYSVGGVTTIGSGSSLNLEGAAALGTLDIAGGRLGGKGTVTTAVLDLSSGTCVGSGDLTVTNNFNQTGGSIASGYRKLSLTRSSGDFLAGGLTAVQSVSLNAKAGTLTINGNLAAPLVQLAGLKVEVLSDVTASMDVEIATGSLTLSDATISASNNLSVSASGAVALQGESVPTKLSANGRIDIRAEALTLEAAGAGVAIDPTTVNIVLTGDLQLIGGNLAGAAATIEGQSVSISAADVLLTGGTASSGASYAAITASAGNLTVTTPETGRITLTPGPGTNADAALLAASGEARLTTGNCIGCSVLTQDPLGIPGSDFGIFAASVILSGATPETGGALLVADNSVTQAVILAQTAASADQLYQGVTDEQDNRRRRLPTCPVR